MREVISDFVQEMDYYAQYLIRTFSWQPFFIFNNYLILHQ
jgi:hypothetical protein